MSYIATNKKSLIFELLAAVLLISEDSWKYVMHAVLYCGFNGLIAFNLHSKGCDRGSTLV